MSIYIDEFIANSEIEGQLSENLSDMLLLFLVLFYFLIWSKFKMSR